MYRRYTGFLPFCAGAQARIWEATDLLSGQPCLLKCGSGVEEEAFLARELDHPYIAAPYDFGEHPDLGVYAAYRHYTNQTICQAFVDPESILAHRTVSQIAEFLAYLHFHRHLYHDFKPEHFLIEQDRIVVLDLGLSRPLDDSHHFTFSGTFPYISPERLLGRKCDERSDIFGLGMMLLHCFFPEEDWSGEPSLGTLRELQKKVDQLPGGFWKNLISDMISMEPSQRIRSAVELWRRMLPSSAKSIPLFFPIRPSVSLDPDLLRPGLNVFFRSGSSLFLSTVEKELSLYCWRNRYPLLTCDLRFISVEEGMKTLHLVLSGMQPEDVFSVSGNKNKVNRPCFVLLRLPDRMDVFAESSLFLAISTLAASGIHLWLLGNPGKREFLDENFMTVDISPLDRQTQIELLKQTIPFHGNVRKHFEKKKISLPEQLAVELKMMLPQEIFDFWPAGAADAIGVRNFELLEPVKVRILTALAIAGGKLTIDCLSGALSLSGQKNPLLQLKDSGYVQMMQNQVILLLPAGQILSRVRKDRKISIAVKLWPFVAASNDSLLLYRVAATAHFQREAATIALKRARSLSSGSHQQEAFNWYWRAFRSGARLPSSLLCSLSNYFLKTGKYSRTCRLLKTARKQRKFYWRWQNLCLEYWIRTEKLDRAEKLVRFLIRRSEKVKALRASSYFQIRLAGIYISQSRFTEAETTLQKILSDVSSLTRNSRALALHFYGLSLLYRNQLDAALPYFQESSGIQHPYQASSLMNCGIIYGRKGNFELAKKTLLLALQSSSIRHDIERRCLVHNNLGVLLKRAGDFAGSRRQYLKSLHLSRAGKNHKMAITVLQNLAVTYELEGKLKKALSLTRRAIHLARKHNLLYLLAAALTNAGERYAILGKQQKSIRLLQDSLRIRKELRVPLYMAQSYESLGVAYLLFHYPDRARKYFVRSLDLFQEAGSITDFQRSQIYLAIATGELNRIEEMEKLLHLENPPSTFTLEEALYHYATGFRHLRNEPCDFSLCREALRKAESGFRTAPSLFWLAKTYLLKAELLEKKDHHEKAAMVFQAACDLLAKLGAERELFYLTKGKKLMMNQNFLELAAEKLPYRILMLVRETLAAQSSEEMIRKILTSSIEFTGMERAALVLKEDPPRIFRSAAVDQSEIQDICDISLSALREASESTERSITFDTASDAFLRNRPSIVSNRIMSIVCVPLKVEEKTIGVLYLDTREETLPLAPSEKMMLEIFGSVTAIALNNSLILERSLEENEQLRLSAGVQPAFPEVLAKSKRMLEILKAVEKISQNDLPVLITGETGTGKELIARAIHYRSRRKNQPFVAINCSAISKNLLESELFGHEKGAFTGAIQAKKGIFEEAENGTLFLDEIAEMPRSMQAKLLRVLQEREFRRVGGSRTLKTNARVIFATNVDLFQKVQEKKFREDLYYRICRVQISLPPLRHRVEDIPLLASYFLKNVSVALKKNVHGLAPETLRIMKEYSWPGNVRELRSEIERLVTFTEKEWIIPDELDPKILQSTEEKRESDQRTIKEIEKEIIQKRLEEYNWNILRAARSLGLTRPGLYGKMRLYGIRRK